MILDVYCNLHKKCLSTLHTTGKQYGRLYQHARTVIITDAKFTVRKGGYRKALETQTRNVHALVRGECILDADIEALKRSKEAIPVRYNYKIMGSFFRADTMEPVTGARIVIIDGKKMWCFDPVSPSSADTFKLTGS